MRLEANETEIHRLEKELRIFKKRLERSESDRGRLEQTNSNKEALLKRVICELQKSQDVLERKSMALEQAFNQLTTMQDQLVEAEKMAALGNLVAGVAHEINTPVGTSITLASTLMDETQQFTTLVEAGQLKRSTLTNYLSIARESTTLILSNLTRAGELVQSFKQIAVDQSSLGQRTFAVKPYLEEVVVSLSPQFKQMLHRLTIDGDETIMIHSYPGALAQVVTNLVNNSLLHAYQPGEQGQLGFEVVQQTDRITLRYYDRGCGITESVLGKIFEPFFTTAREKGGTGLGLHITYNLVTQKLQGSIDVQSELGQGTQFIMSLPLAVTP